VLAQLVVIVGCKRLVLVSAVSTTATLTSPDITSREVLVFQFEVADNENQTVNDSVSITVNPLQSNTYTLIIFLLFI